MQFKVPQFIEVEDKIFGPFTFKQFIYLLGGGGLTFILWKLLPHVVAIFFILPVLAFSLALTFYRVNNKPFIDLVQSFFEYTTKDKLYVWRKEANKKEEKKDTPVDTTTSYVPRLSDSKLKEISWGLDVIDLNKKSE